MDAQLEGSRPLRVLLQLTTLKGLYLQGNAQLECDDDEGVCMLGELSKLVRLRRIWLPEHLCRHKSAVRTVDGCDVHWRR